MFLQRFYTNKTKKMKENFQLESLTNERAIHSKYLENYPIYTAAGLPSFSIEGHNVEQYPCPEEMNFEAATRYLYKNEWGV